MSIDGDSVQWRQVAPFGNRQEQSAKPRNIEHAADQVHCSRVTICSDSLLRNPSKRLLQLGSRMMLGVQLLETLARDMGVDLSGGEITMAEQHLYDAQIGPMVQQMGRKGVPQGVRR